MRNDSLKGDLSGDIRIFSAQGNFTKPVGKQSILKSGLKSSWVWIEDATEYRNKQVAVWQPDWSSNNQNKYSENINAAYIQWESKFGRWSLNAGIRLENTRIDASYIPDDPTKTDSSYTQNYTNLFPNMALQYNPNDKNIFSLSYSRRINRPNYRDMLPFNQIWDKYTNSQGNPNLKPEMTDQFELAYIYRKTYRITFGLLHATDAMAKNFRITEDNVVTVFPDNISSRLGYWLRLDMQNFLPPKWWQQVFSISLMRAYSSWIENDEKKKNGLFTVNLNTNHQFFLGKGWSAEINGSYNGKMNIAQTTIQPFGVVNLGVRKKLFKDNASIRIFAEDIFLTQYESLLIDFNNFKSRAKTINDSGTIGIAFSYNFKHGEQKRKISQERKIDESKRVNL